MALASFPLEGVVFAGVASRALVSAVAILVAAGGFVGGGADDGPEVDDPAE